MRAPDPAATARLRFLAGPRREPVAHEPAESGEPVDPPTAELPLTWASPVTLSGYVRTVIEARVPAPLQGGRSEPGRRGIAAAIAIAIAIAAAAALALAVDAVAVGWASRGQAHPVARSAVRAPAAASTAAALLATTDVEVDVEGRVRRPGLVTLPAGARIADAIRAAGGALPGTDTRDLDLAQRVIDGQQLRVGVPAAVASTWGPAGTPSPPTGASATAGAGGGGQ